jgi:hypothetical protein
MGLYKRHLVVFAAVAFFAASVPLRAAPITWQLGGVTFSDGATASGTFIYDASLDTYSAWNISVTAGIFTTFNYQLGVDGGFVGNHPAGQVDFVAFPSGTPGRYLRLAFSSPLTGRGGTHLLLTDHSGYECNNCSTFRYITGGAVSTITAVPEPPSITLISVALTLLGLGGTLPLRGRRAKGYLRRHDSGFQ